MSLNNNNNFLNMTLIHSYEDFVAKNAPLITLVENSFRSFSYLLPGRFQDAALISEIVYSLVNMFKWYNDSIYYKVNSTLNEKVPWNEFVRLLEHSSPSTAAFLRVYNLMRMGQVPVEMLIERLLGFEKKLLFCFITESLK